VRFDGEMFGMRKYVKIDTPYYGDVAACLLSEADCKAVVKDKKVRVEDFVFLGEDFGEL
jgi:hypothetical protein